MLESLDLSLSLTRNEYMVQLARRQIQLRELGWQVYQQKRPAIILFEGWDAAGKLPAPIRIGGRVVWRVAEIRAWLAAGAPDREAWAAMVAARRQSH